MIVMNLIFLVKVKHGQCYFSLKVLLDLWQGQRSPALKQTHNLKLFSPYFFPLLLICVIESRMYC